MKDLELTRSNAGSARKTVDALRSRLGDIDEARVTAFLLLAEALDARPWNDRLWREYREAEIMLRGEADDVTDAERAVIDALFAEVGDETLARPANAGLQGGRRG